MKDKAQQQQVWRDVMYLRRLARATEANPAPWKPERIERMSYRLRLDREYARSASALGSIAFAGVFQQKDPGAFELAEAWNDPTECACCFFRETELRALGEQLSLASSDLPSHRSANENRVVFGIVRPPSGRPLISAASEGIVSMAAGATGGLGEGLLVELEQLRGAKISLSADGQSLTLTLGDDDSTRDAREFVVRVAEQVLRPVAGAERHQATFDLSGVAGSQDACELLHWLDL